MIAQQRHSSYLILALFFSMATVSVHADPLLITGSVSPQANRFLYNFAITNQSAIDPYGKLVSVDFPSLPIGSVVGSAVAPNGFSAVTDLDYILFSYNNASSFPLNITTNGFQFVSTMMLSSINFEASYLNTSESQLEVFTGRVVPQAASAVPEPSTWALLASAFVLLLGRKTKAAAFSQLAGRIRNLYSV